MPLDRPELPNVPMWQNQLLERVKKLSKACPKLSHTFRFLTSAILALHKSETLGHKNRAEYAEADRVEHNKELLSTIDDLQRGILPNDRWMAGFYYNAAVMRIDACYERLLKAMPKRSTGDVSNPSRHESKTNRLARGVETYFGLRYPHFARQKLEANRDEVNNLKHGLFGQPVADAKSRGTGDIENAKAAVDELLEMMEHGQVLAMLESRYARDAPP
jgi:hypothetical protein